MAKYLDENGLLYYNQKLDTKFNGKVDKDGNKVLSDVNFTSAYETKLKGLENYTLPTASAETLGGIKVGAGLTISEQGTLSATGGGTADSVAWENVQDKPTTIAGYGITDAKISGQVVTLGSNSVTVPTNNNQLTNGAGYQTENEVETIVTGYGYQTATQVQSIVTSYGYQTASQVQSAIADAVGDITGFDFQIVEELPGTGQKGVIYLISNSGTGQNIYDEYIWTGTAFEKIGTTDVDLSNYWSKTDLVAITNGEIDTIVGA